MRFFLPSLENGQDQSDDDWGDSDDEEEERGGPDGYQLLPQELPSHQLTQEPDEQSIMNHILCHEMMFVD